jgi:protein-tyrosine phosphatase
MISIARGRHTRCVAIFVLFVCEGNICRSPIAERLFLHSADAQVTAGSAGLRALVGQPMSPDCARALGEFGVAASGHEAVQFEADVARSAALILTAQEWQREAVLRLLPTVLRRTFTLKEFARLGRQLPADVPDEPVPQRIARVAAMRGAVDAPAPGADDIADPFGKSGDMARRCTAEIAAAVTDLVRVLGVGSNTPVTDRSAPH